MSAPQDPNRIDVSLNIISNASLEAVKQLTEQVKGLRELVGGSTMTNPASQAAAMGGAAAYTRPGETQAGIFHGVSQPVQGGSANNPSEGARLSKQERQALRDEYKGYYQAVVHEGVSSPPPTPAAEQMMIHEMSDIQRFRLARAEKRTRSGNVRSAYDRFFELYPGAERDTGEDRTAEDSAGERRGGAALPEVPRGMTTAAGGVSSGASVPGGGGRWDQPPRPPAPPGGGGGPDNTAGEPGWAQALIREGITPESRLAMTVPRIGEYTMQDKLNFFAHWMGRAAQRRGTTDASGNTKYDLAGTIMGRAGAGAAYLRDQSASLVALNNEFQRVRGFAREQELSGEALGFSRESKFGDLEMFGVGGRINLLASSAAQREAIHQEWSQRRVQAAPGVSGEEAQRIKQIVSGMGYSRDLNANLQLNMFRNLQQRGIDPEAVAPLVDQGVRQGNSSISSLRGIMYDLADAARHAHMTLQDVMESTAEYAESVQEVGASYESALKNAAVFTRVGLDPRIASQAMKNPMVQGNLATMTGLPPEFQGIVSAAGVAQAISTTVQQGLALGTPYLNMPDRTLTSESGEKVPISTGRDAQIAMAQHASGVPRQVIERIIKDPKFLEKGAVASQMLEKTQGLVQGMSNRQVERTITPTTRVPVVGPNGIEYKEMPNADAIKETVTERRNLTASQLETLTKAKSGDSIFQVEEIEQQLIALDPKNKQWTDRVRRLGKEHKDIEDRLKSAGDLLGEAMETSPEPDYILGLTDEAAKALQIEKPKDRNGALPRANAGGTPANSNYLGPSFDANTGGAFRYGNPYR
jgi:hypothetical protein